MRYLWGENVGKETLFEVLGVGTDFCRRRFEPPPHIFLFLSPPIPSFALLLLLASIKLLRYLATAAGFWAVLRHKTAKRRVGAHVHHFRAVAYVSVAIHLIDASLLRLLGGTVGRR